MYQLLAQMGVEAYNTWNASQASKEAMRQHRKELKINRFLAMEQLAFTQHSILAKNLEVHTMRKRKLEELQIQKRQQEGALIAQAAVHGVAGKRATLARDMAVAGGTERAMTRVELDAKRETDALIMRSNMEEKATVNRLISSMPDAPVEFGFQNILNSFANVAGYVGGAMDRKAALDRAAAS